jgi:transcription antitermination factor NusG
MSDFKIGDTVQITGSVMQGSVGTVVSYDEERQKYLVRITGEIQNYYPAHELKLYSA